jgi:hypothetical protein
MLNNNALSACLPSTTATSLQPATDVVVHAITTLGIASPDRHTCLAFSCYNNGTTHTNTSDRITKPIRVQTIQHLIHINTLNLGDSVVTTRITRLSTAIVA